MIGGEFRQGHAEFKLSPHPVAAPRRHTQSGVMAVDIVEDTALFNRYHELVAKCVSIGLDSSKTSESVAKEYKPVIKKLQKGRMHLEASIEIDYDEQIFVASGIIFIGRGEKVLAQWHSANHFSTWMHSLTL